jgi:hypothetical protein
LHSEPTTLLQGTLDLLILKSRVAGEMHGLGVLAKNPADHGGTFDVKPGSLFPLCTGWRKRVGFPHFTFSSNRYLYSHLNATIGSTRMARRPHLAGRDVRKELDCASLGQYAVGPDPVIRQPSLGTNSECRIPFGGPIHVTVPNHNINATNVANLLGWISVHQDHAGVLAQRYRTKIMVHVQASGPVQRLSLPGGHLEDGASGGAESRAPCRGVVPASRLYCHESEPAEPGGRAVLQQTGYSGAMDQGGQAGSTLDAVVLSSLPSE